MISIKICCENCKKNKTMKCPNSTECYSLENKPHWTPIDVEYKMKLNPIQALVKKIKKLFNK